MPAIPVKGCCRSARDAAQGQQNEHWALWVAHRTIDLRTSPGPTWVDIEMDQGVPQFGPMVVGERSVALREDLGLTRDHLHRALPMQVVSTGLDCLIVPVAGGLEQARICRPDFEALRHEVGVKFGYVLDLERPEGRTWDNAGRLQDVATGSAAGPAAGYLRRHQIRPDDEPQSVDLR